MNDSTKNSGKSLSWEIEVEKWEVPFDGRKKSEVRIVVWR